LSKPVPNLISGVVQEPKSASDVDVEAAEADAVAVLVDEDESVLDVPAEEADDCNATLFTRAPVLEIS
jgi:hypothetical protein